MLITALLEGKAVSPAFQPQTNEQAYLAYLNGLDIDLPEPRTMKEVLLYNLCAKGGTGGGVELTGTDGNYLFADSARLDKMDSILAMCKELTSLQYMFYGADATKFSFDMSKIDTSKVTTVKAMFSASDVVSVDMRNNDMSACTDFDSMFYNCQVLEEIIGFSAPNNNYSFPVSFPKGSSSTKYKLKRLTFRTDIPCAIASAIDIRNNSFEREGIVEMLNTLPDVTSLDLGSYRTSIYISGNPCVSNGTLTDEDRAIATDKGWTLVEA